MKKIDLFPDSISDVTEVPKPGWKHRAYYDFLGISPSYFSVHLYKTNRLHVSKIRKIDSYKKILEMYELFGDVYSITFDDWWDSGGYKLFEPHQKFDFLYRIDLKKSLARNQEELKLIYQSHKSKLKYYSPALIFEKNKTQEWVLHNRLNLIHKFIDIAKSCNDGNSQNTRDIPNWFLAYADKKDILGRVSGKSFTRIRPAIKFEEIHMSYIPEKLDALKAGKIPPPIKRPFLRPVSVKNTTNKAANKAKRYLSMLISKNKREALVIAENASRGIFPSKEKLLPSYLNFDFNQFASAPEFNIPLIERILSYNKLPYVTGSNSKTKQKLFENRRLEMEIEHRLLETVETDLKETIDKKAEEIYNKKYKKIIDKVAQSSKSIRQRSSSVRR